MGAKYRLLLGGIGDDAHSVGIGLLELGFREKGFFVHNLGIRNDLNAFFERAADFDVILISNKNGHAELYLEEFPGLLRDFRAKGSFQPLWYLGGSLSVSESDFSIKKKFIKMGFTNVYPRPQPFETVFREVVRDLIKFGIPSREAYSMQDTFSRPKRLPDKDGVIDRKWEKEELQAERIKVLSEWDTGREVWEHEESAIPLATPSLDSLLWKKHHSDKAKPPLFQPRTGVACIDEQINLLSYLEKMGSPISSVQLDAASRSKCYDKAKLGIKISLERKKSALNGFPIPVYGIREVTRLVQSLHTPFQLRGGGPDHRFTYEIALKTGISGLEGGALCYLLPYDKLTSPVESLRYWQYIDRLCTQHQEKQDYLINREFFGVLTATLIEPSLAIVVNVIQALLSAQQGIRSITVGYAEQGNRLQDIAALQVMEEKVKAYLKRYKFDNCRVTTVFHQYMAAFPSDTVKAEELIRSSSTTSVMAGATKVMIKTPVEAQRIPSVHDNARALQLCRKGASTFPALTPHQQSTLETERKMLQKEVHQLMEATLESGSGSFVVGMLRAIEEGYIDIPWSPNRYNRGQVVGGRDIDGAIRFFEFGNLPFSAEVRDFHQEKVHLRKSLERDPSTFSILEKDLSRIWQNDYQTWPLDGHYVR